MPVAPAPPAAMSLQPAGTMFPLAALAASATASHWCGPTALIWNDASCPLLGSAGNGSQAKIADCEAACLKIPHCNAINFNTGHGTGDRCQLRRCDKPVPPTWNVVDWRGYATFPVTPAPPPGHNVSCVDSFTHTKGSFINSAGGAAGDIGFGSDCGPPGSNKKYPKLSIAEAKATCCKLGAECVGFSWPVAHVGADGKNSGCFEKNKAGMAHEAGIDGYEKVGGPVTPAPPPMKLVLLKKQQAATGAACLDGSAPGFYWEAGTGADANKWVVFLNGGGWCYTLAPSPADPFGIPGGSKATGWGNADSCWGRSRSGLGSTLPVYNPPTAKGGWLANTPMANWSKASVIYCDGTSFGGNRDEPVVAAGTGSPVAEQNRTLYFRGQRNLDAVLDELKSRGMASAEMAVLGGCSAGGLGALVQCDHFAAALPGVKNKRCIGDAGVFIDATSLTSFPSAANHATMRRFQQEFSAAVAPAMAPTSKHGAFIDNCATCHCEGMWNSRVIDGVRESDALEGWLLHGQPAKFEAKPIL